MDIETFYGFKTIGIRFRTFLRTTAVIVVGSAASEIGGFLPGFARDFQVKKDIK